MNKNGINNNDINKKFEFLTNEIKLLKDEDVKNKITIKKNVENIINLNYQLMELKRFIHEIKEKYDQQYKYLLNIILERKDNEKKNKIKIDKINNIEGININQNDNKNDKKLLIKDKFYFTPKGKDKISNFQKGTLEEKFEIKLVDLIFDENINYKKNDLNNFRKISTALIIKGKKPGEIVDYFFNKNINNFYDEINQEQMFIIESKKTMFFLIFADIQNVLLLKGIDKIKIDEFIKELREICGIIQEDIKNEDLMKEIKNNKYNRTNTIKSILLKMKLI